MPISPEQIGSVPQSQAMNQQGIDPEVINYFRTQDPEIKQAIEMFIGKPVSPEAMNAIPDKEIMMLAGLVQKLGVEGAVQMAEKMIPADMKQKLRA